MVTIHTTFPRILPLRVITEAVFERREEMEWRVDGGTISTRAAMRSKRVSSVESSDETEERDAEDEVRDEESEA